MALDPLNSSSLEQLALKGLNNTEYRRTHLIDVSDVHLKKKLKIPAFIWDAAFKGDIHLQEIVRLLTLSTFPSLDSHRTACDATAYSRVGHGLDASTDLIVLDWV